MGALRSRRDGVAAVEFSLVALPFFALLVAILETGYFYFLAVQLQGAAAEGARQVRTGVVQQAETTELALADLKTRVCNNVTSIGCSDLIFDVRSYLNFEAISETPPPLILPEDAAFLPGSAGSTVVVRVAYTWNFVTPFLKTVIDKKQLVSTITFRNEPFQPQSN
jgi:Flp pilus assembly protein TadG